MPDGSLDSVYPDDRLPEGSWIDARTLKDVKRRGFTYKGSKTGLPGIPDSVKDVGGYVELKGGDAPPDADHDGMPDAWETANKLNPNDAADGNGDGKGDGYTNLESYLNSIVAAPPAAAAAVPAGDQQSPIP